MKRIFLCLSATLILSFSGFSQITESWKTLDESDYTISYPPNWELNQAGQMGTKFILFSPLKTAADNFRENVNMVTQDISGQNIDLDKYAELSANQIQSMGMAVKFIDSKKLTIDGQEFQHVLYTMEQGAYNLTIDQFYIITETTAYVLTFTAETKAFEEYKALGERILNSFRLK